MAVLGRAKGDSVPKYIGGVYYLSPGGNQEPADHPRASSEAGSIYLIETWPGSARGSAPLQLQIQALFGALAAHLGSHEPVNEYVNNQVMSAYFIPFRSPRLTDLPRRKVSIAFAQTLWRDILAHWSPRLLITIDTDTFASLHDILTNRPRSKKIEHRRFDTGWGNYQAEAIRIARDGNEKVMTLARLPHLSTFKLFSRAACRPHLTTFLNYVAD